MKRTTQVKMRIEDYNKVRRARGAVEAFTGRKITSLSEAIGLMADFWFKVYVKSLSREAQEVPELLKVADSPLVKRLAEEWVKG